MGGTQKIFRAVKPLYLDFIQLLPMILALLKSPVPEHSSQVIDVGQKECIKSE